MLAAFDMCEFVHFVVMMADTFPIHPPSQKSKVSSMKVTNVISTERAIFHRIKNGRAWSRVQKRCKRAKTKPTRHSRISLPCNVFPLTRAFVQKLEELGCNVKIS